MWIDNNILTPRERLLHHLARVLQMASIVNAILAIVCVLVISLLGVNAQTLGQALMLTFDPTQQYPLGTATLILLMGLVANAGILLLLSASIMAQENGSWLLALGAIVVNGLALVGWGMLPALITIVITLYCVGRMWADRGAFHVNPVTLKELRGRMRGVRSFAVISVFLALMGLFTVLLYVLSLSELSGSTVIETGQLGRMLFRGVVGIELVLVVLIVPALTAGAVTGERERQTYDLLATTLLPIPSFLFGKMVSALGFMLLLIVAAVPLQSIAFLFGGISQIEVLLAFAGLLVTAFLLAALGLYLSATTERTLTATVRVYVLTLAIVFGLPVATFVVNSFIGQPIFTTLVGNGAYGNAILGVRTIDSNATAETSAIYADMLVTGLNPVLTALYTQEILVNHQQTALFSARLASNGETIPVLAPWVILITSYLAMASIMVLVSIRRMRRNEG